DARVVDRPRVVTIVEVDIHRGEVELEVVAEIPPQLAAEGRFVETVRGIAARECIRPESIALVTLCNETESGIGPGYRAAKDGARSVRPVVGAGGFAAELPDW